MSTITCVADAQSPGVLCSNCQNFNIQTFTRDQFPYRGYRLIAVIQAARAGCSFCSLVLECLKAVADDDPLPYLAVTDPGEFAEAYKGDILTPQRLRLAATWLATVIFPPWVHLSVERGRSEDPDCLDITHINAFINVWTGTTTWFDRDPRSTVESIVRFHVAADEGTPASTLRDITGRLADSRSLSLDMIKDIKGWHTKCSKEHDKCNKTLSGTLSFDVERVPLPSRCIEILQSDPSGRIPCRWILRETSGQEGKYIVLSHRWGVETFNSRTTRENYRNRLGMHQGEDSNDSPDVSTAAVGELPRMLEDTCSLADRLGIKYVWIDSICIIQDDIDDWSVESVKMADYYQHAWLSVAGTSQSFFRTLETAELPRVSRLPYRDKTGDQQGYFYLQCAGSKPLATEFRTEISQSGLLQRGWVYQEWMLSRRLICFSSRGIFMQCSSSLPESSTGDVVNYKLDWNSIEFAVKKSMDFNLTSMHRIITAWQRIVRTYSGLQLSSFVEDRLVALAGVANEFGKAIKSEGTRGKPMLRTEKLRQGKLADRYVCGLWLRGVYTGLLWEQVHRGPRARVRGFPTWSWASMASYETGPDGHQTLTGMAVRWPQMVRRCALVPGGCRVEEAVAVPVERLTWQPDFSRPLGDEVPGEEYGNNSRFVLLKARGCLLPVRLAPRFTSKEDTTVAATLSGLFPFSNYDRSFWRRVCLPSRPDSIVGYASVEDPAFQTDEACLAAEGLCALFVNKIKVPGGFGFGNLGAWHMAFDVLFVRPMNIEGFDPCYERLGVGKMFSNDVEVLYQSAEERTAWLA